LITYSSFIERKGDTMSDQEMMYHPPEQSSHEPPPMPINTDPREQEGAQQSYEDPYAANVGSASYDEGYRGPYAAPSSTLGEKIQPRRRISLDLWQLILLLVAAFIVGAGLGGSIFNGFFGFLFAIVALVVAFIAIAKIGFDKAVPILPHNFLVNDTPTLIVRNPAGSIHIHRGKVNEVLVQGTKHITTIFGNNQDLPVEFAQEGNTIRVKADGMGGNPNVSLNNMGHVDLDITVPEFCDLQVDGNAGVIRVTGTNGKANLKTSAGAIHIEQATMEDAQITTNAGTLNFEQSLLKGQANIETNAGTIHFAGVINAGGNYRMHTNAGTIHTSLPGSSSFVLKAHTDLGTVKNEFGNSVVGGEPHATLDLRTNLGTIHVERIS
jgi:hypothetical protein